MNIPYLTDEEIETRAEEFLQEYNPDRTIPVPIEEIAEIDLEIEIFPIPGFQERFAVVGYISYDLATLTVDEHIMKRVPARYRFTIAHELSHFRLHGDYIRGTYPNSEADWRTKLLNADRKLYTRLEAQANRMAGAILVPRAELTVAWEEAKLFASQRGFEVDEIDEVLVSYLAAHIARDFQVAGKTVEIALDRYDLVPELRGR